MARIRWVEDHEAFGPIADVYNGWKVINPGRERIPEILKCMSLRPDFLREMITVSYGLHFSDGFLPRRVKEMIATYVSALNHCPY